MKYKTYINIELNEDEAIGLKKILGCISDDEKHKLGLTTVVIESLRALWDNLPYEEEKDES